MARRNHINEAPSSPPSSASPSAALSPASSSDKENRHSRRGKRKSDQAMPSTSRNPTADSASSGTKRRRLAELQSNTQSTQPTQFLRSSQRPVTDFYDPDQNVQERREIRKSLRDLTRDLNDCRNEYLQTGNKGIINTIQKANDIFTRVKQTSDATVDSQLLVSAADLSYKKSARLALGGGVAGIDVDEFASKCMSFMLRGPLNESSAITSSTQRRTDRKSVV